MPQLREPISLGEYDRERLKINLSDEDIINFISLPRPALDNFDAWSKMPLTSSVLLMSHEIVHWYQDIGTPLGIAYQYFLEAPKFLTKELCQALHKESNGAKIRLSVINHMEQFDETHIVTFIVNLVTFYKEIRAILDGSKITTEVDVLNLLHYLSHDYANIDIAIKYWGHLEKISKKNSCETDLSAPYTRSGYPLGSIVIQEGHARATEDLQLIVNILNQRPYDKNLTVLDPRKWTDVYTVAIDHMKYIMGWEDLHTLSMMDLYYKLYTFCAIADLAMASPIAPMYAASWLENYSWKDYHPGWRFDKICKAIKSMKLELHSEDTSEYGHFINKISDYLHWETPNNIYSKSVTLDEGWIISLLSERVAAVRGKCPDIMIHPLLLRPGNEECMSELQLGVPPPYIGLKDLDSELVSLLYPPLIFGNVTVASSKELGSAIDVNKYAAALPYSLIWTGSPPQNIPETLTEYDTIELLTGFPKESFVWKGAS